jgi:hypothetical protein
MTLRPSSHHVNTTLNKGTTMPTFGQTLTRFNQLLHSNQTLLATITSQLNELAMQYYYDPSDDNKARFEQHGRYYDELFEKVDCINTAYRQFLKDGTVPEWL